MLPHPVIHYLMNLLICVNMFLLYHILLIGLMNFYISKVSGRKSKAYCIKADAKLMVLSQQYYKIYS